MGSIAPPKYDDACITVRVGSRDTTRVFGVPNCSARRAATVRCFSKEPSRSFAPIEDTRIGIVRKQSIKEAL